MGTKIQINSLEALERLIGNDNELEIEIRSSIVQEFAKKHLKAIANEPTFQNEITTFKQKLQGEFDKKMEESIASVKRYYHGASIEKVTLHPELEASIKSKVRELVDELVSKRVKDVIEEYYNEEVLTKRINVMMDHNIKVLVNEKIKAKIDSIKASL